MSRLWLVFCALAAPALAAPPATGPVTHLPLPRFVTLRTDEVNVRAGPGFQYPVTAIYHRDGLPVEIIGEFDVWRQLDLPDGGTGWVHEATLRGRRGFYITAPEATLYDAPSDSAGTVATLRQGVSGVLLSCAAESPFCKATIQGRTGYLARTDFWGTLPDEAFK
jgi:SH3-like domain-containing protein